MKTLKDIYELGFERGFTAASWVDLPEIGQKTQRSVDWVGIGTIETADDAAEYFECLASDAESHSRDFSPFEFLASELNGRDDADEAWEQFDAGIHAGIAANWKSRADGFYDD